MSSEHIGPVSSASTRWTLLAGVRFFLASVVLLGHLDLLDPMGNSWTRMGTWWNQGSAVYGFLIISGYSIAASINRVSKGFYLRRFWRIFPTYAISVVIAVSAGLFINGSLKVSNELSFYKPTGVQILAAIFMVQSFLGNTLSTDGQLWTLAVEWWNYMLAPLFNKLSASAILTLISFSLGIYLIFPAPANPALSSNGEMYVLLSWYWLIGFLYYRLRRTPLGLIVLFFPIAIAVCTGWVGRAAIIGLFAVALCDEIRVPRRLKGVIEWLGELSFPLYAMHVPAIVVCLLFGIHSPAVALAAAVAASISTLHAVDLPLRRWGIAHAGRKGGRRAKSAGPQPGHASAK